MTRHVKEFHNESFCANDKQPPERYVCVELGCGKVFKLDPVEALFVEPGCMKVFTNKQCLKEHMQSCHQYIICDKCGIKQLKKNIKHHMRKHEASVSLERIKCIVERCFKTVSTTSNLNQHVKAVHL